MSLEGRGTGDLGLVDAEVSPADSKTERRARVSAFSASRRLDTVSRRYLRPCVRGSMPAYTETRKELGPRSSMCPRCLAVRAAMGAG